MDAVAARNLRKSYGDTTALDGVDLSVGSGEAFALVGPNGAGKTTLVRCLTGTARPDAGSVDLLGGPPGDADPERVGLLPQSFAPAERLTARELVTYYAGLYDDARDPEAALDDVGLDQRDTWYAALSGGQQRRACVAATLVNDPEVLFLDEPTAGVDPEGRRALRGLLADLVAGGSTLVFTTHDMATAERLADRVGMLAEGRLVATGAPEALIATHTGEPTLFVETAADLDSVAGFAAERVPDGLRLSGVDPADVGDVVRALDDAGVSFAALEWAEPSLEDAYLAATGSGGAGDPTTEIDTTPGIELGTGSESGSDSGNSNSRGGGR
jgi:ABC-2 type transport system ATP-binding protein